MRMQRVLSFLKIAPIAASLVGATAFSGYAAEAPLPIESRQSTANSAPSPTESISAEPAAEPMTAGLSALPDFQNDRPAPKAFAAADQRQWQIANHLVLNTVLPTVEDGARYTNVSAAVTANTTPAPSEPEPELEQPKSTLTEAPGQAQLTLSAAAAAIENPAAIASFGEVQLSPIAQPKLAQISGDWQIAQTEPAPEPASASETPETIPKAEDSSGSPRWRFNVIPNAFLPLGVDGHVTVRDFRADLNLGLDDILEQLNFALAGRVEAWRGNLGLVFDAAYFDLGQDRSVALPLPNCLCNVLPSRINTEINVQYGQFDLGVGYRYGTNLSSAATEFEMGPLVLDAILGIRIYTFAQEIKISTNLGDDRNLQSNTTLITPLLSGRIRWNVSPTLAGWVRGDLAGFGIGGTLFATSFTVGIDWLFTGNTSLLVAYRLSTLHYTVDVRGEELGLNLFLHGPYVGVVFRF